MRSQRIRVGPKEITDGLVRRGRFGIERHTDTQRDNKGRDGRDAPPRTARSHQKLGERPGMDFPSDPLEKNNPLPP